MIAELGGTAALVKKRRQEIGLYYNYDIHSERESNDSEASRNSNSSANSVNFNFLKNDQGEEPVGSDNDSLGCDIPPSLV